MYCLTYTYMSDYKAMQVFLFINRRFSQQSMAFYRVSRCLVHKQWSRILVLHFTYISSVLASTCAPFSRNHSPNLYFERVISCSENEASVGVTNRGLYEWHLFKTLNDKIIKCPWSFFIITFAF